LQRYPVRHIACKETIKRMVKGDWCSVEHPIYRFGPPARLTPGHGREAVRAARDLLREYDSFQLALAEREDDALFSSYWKTLGGRAVFLETWRHQRGQVQVNLVIREENVVFAFGQHFQQCWDKLTKDSGRKEVIDWLESLLG